MERPRKILLMIKAGQPVDDYIQALFPNPGTRGTLLSTGGNSHFIDTRHRCELLESRKILYVGMGISGGRARGFKGDPA